jgi:hypothetical protein
MIRKCVSKIIKKMLHVGFEIMVLKNMSGRITQEKFKIMKTLIC